MELDPVSGARLTYSVFDVNGDGAVNDDDYVGIKDSGGNDIKVPVSGKQFDELTTTPSVVEMPTWSASTSVVQRQHFGHAGRGGG